MIGVLTTWPALTVQRVYALWYLCADVVYVVLFLQLVILCVHIICYIRRSFGGRITPRARETGASMTTLVRIEADVDPSFIRTARPSNP